MVKGSICQPYKKRILLRQTGIYIRNFVNKIRVKRKWTFFINNFNIWHKKILIFFTKLWTDVILSNHLLFFVQLSNVKAELRQAFSTCVYCQCNFFENATESSKRTLKTRVVTSLKLQMIDFKEIVKEIEWTIDT